MKAYIIGGGTFLLFGTTIFAYINAENKYDSYAGLTESASVDDFNAKWSDFKAARSINIIFFVLGISGYLYNLVDAAFLGSPENMSFDKRTVKVKLAHRNIKIEYQCSY